MIEHPTGMQLFACSSDDELAIEEAKNYIKNNGYNANNVKLIKMNGQVIVVKK